MRPRRAFFGVGTRAAAAGAAAAAVAAASLALVSCDPLLSGSLPSDMAESAMVQHLPYSGTFRYTVDPGSTPRDVYLVFTNPSLSQDASHIPSVEGSITVDGKRVPAPAPQRLPSSERTPQSRLDQIAEFNRNPSQFLPSFPVPSGATVSVPPAQNDQAGVSVGTFGLDLDSSGNAVTTVPATCRKVIGPVMFTDGRRRTLSIWVDDTYWSTEVSAQMVTDIAGKFLQSSGSDDIYHWDTAVVGEPWGPQPYSNLIPWDTNNTVTILLTHLNTTYTGPSVFVGYFWAKDNFTSSSLPGSNQRIMFYLDSKVYSTNLPSESTYSPDNYWPKIAFSTLAHEFQHMIQFYQKQVVRSAPTGTDTWINEMCSMLMEDLVADKLGVEGPRGVLGTGSAGSAGNTLGRIPEFNANSNYLLANTASGSSYGITDYSLAYAFGAWLIRNYGGAELLRRIVQCPQTDSTAVTNAAGVASGRTETMERLLERWSASVLLSDTTAAPPGYRYNTGGWSSFTEGGQTFNLGSIDLFNYTPTLTVFSGSSSVPVAPYYSSNTYYLAASGLRASRTFSVTTPEGVVTSVVLK